MMRVEILKNYDPSCDAFVRQMPEHKICHLPVWSHMVATSMKHRPFYLVAREDKDIQGVLPLTLIRSRLFGRRMISQAFYTYGGPLVKNTCAMDALYDRAVELATEHNCETIEFRNIKPLPYDLHLRTDKLVMHLPLKSDPDELWCGFKGEIRNRVRKAEKAGIVAVSGGVELLNDFYRMWTIRMHQLGTPAYPRKLMCRILQTFPNNSWVFVVRLGALTIGGGLTTCFNGFADMQWVATRIEYNKLAPGILLHWSVIKHHCLADASCFDFGRSSVDAPTYEFKRRWGTEPVKLFYQYWVRPGRGFSPVVPDNPKYKRRIRIWKKLPLWTTRLIGPYLSRNLP
jgi:FemAB-related protein (PEP-CTERM system-associated)